MITYDVPAVEATGRNPIIPVVVMDKKQGDIAFTDAVISGDLSALDAIFTTRSPISGRFASARSFRRSSRVVCNSSRLA